MTDPLRILDAVLCGDCLVEMTKLPAQSVDAIISDLPYGTTACKWDTVIPFAALWDAWKRLLKPNSAIVLTASQPFTSALVMSNVKAFRHEWIWKKDKGGNIAVLKYQPAKVHESVLVFGFESPRYNPQMEVRPEANRRNNAPRTNRCGVQGDKPFHVERSRGADAVKYPTSVKEYNCVRGGVHPTQKPIELMRYLVRTYTNPGDVVLDPCCGSGTTLLAAKIEGRRYVGIEKEAHYAEITKTRLQTESATELHLPFVCPA
jgi:site-specific DNA-methyltransferase (adenine-specific)